MTYIHGRAFEGCSVKYQYIPESVTTIEGFAMYFTGVIHIYTPYVYMAEHEHVTSTIPDGWSVYFAGYNYQSEMSGVLINSGYGNGCSRTQFMNDRDNYGWD